MTIGRNDPCPCGSGKKYKKCCLEKHAAEERAKAQTATQAAAEARRAQEEAAHAQREQAAREWKERQPPLEPLPDIDPKPAPKEPDWPPLSEADQGLVAAWWKEVGPVYTEKKQEKKREGQAAWLLQRTLEFLEQQPRLFRHLYLHDEFLFELGGALARAGRLDDYLALLRRLRREQPDTYLQCFGYYDHNLIAEAIRSGRREEIQIYLDLFKQHPAKHVDQLADVVDLLAWRGLEKELQELLTAMAQPVFDSPEVLAGGFGLLWLTHLAVFPFFEAGDDSPEAVDRLCQAALAVGYLDESNPDNAKCFRRQLRLAFLPPSEAGLDLKKPQEQWFRHDVAWSFTGWARRNKGLPWTSARFLADALQDYWGWKEEKKKGASPFRLNEAQLDHYLAQRCRNLFWLHGVRAVTTIQAFHYFTDYLVAHGYFDAADARRLQAGGARLFETVRGAVDVCDPAYRICPTYDALIAAPTPG